jgi:succinyl-CoA synthetase alpha subunit
MDRDIESEYERHREDWTRVSVTILIEIRPEQWNAEGPQGDLGLTVADEVAELFKQEAQADVSVVSFTGKVVIDA